MLITLFYPFEDINKHFLSECYRLLSSNGNLIITIPHAFSVAALYGYHT